MTIPPQRLDDLTWAQMMEAIRGRIPAASQGRWTLHAPVDPGITLLELYAYLLEQRLYLLDQVPDDVVRGLLRLLGVAPPAPAVPASTVLVLTPVPAGPAPAPPPPAAAPAGLELVRSLGGRQVVVTTERPVALVPAAVRLTVADADRTADLEGAGGVVLVPGPVDLTLSVAAGFDPPAEAWLSFLVELGTTTGIQPSWAPGAPAAVPPPARITWSYETAPGRFADFAAEQLDDGTGGLRRSGVVRLAWPDAWRPAPGAAPAPGLVDRRLRLVAGDPTFSFPPRLVRLAVNAVVARNRQVVRVGGERLEQLDAQLGDWLRLPGQVLDLDGPGGQFGAAGFLLDDPSTVSLKLRERDGREYSWSATNTLSDHGPAARVFEIDRTAGRLRFGDGLTGRLPVVAGRTAGDGPRLSLCYELGGGGQGNLGLVSWVCDTVPVTGTNPVPLAYGADSETIGQARTRAGDDLAKPTRAVTVLDIREIALTTPGLDLARADVAVGLHPATPCDPVPGAITVIVVPQVPGDRETGAPEVLAPAPDPGALVRVAKALDCARLIGTEMFVRGPRYRPVRLAVTPAAGVADPGGLRKRLLLGLRRYLDPLVGGASGQGWPFGEPVRPSELLGVAQRVAGRSALISSVAVGLDGAPPGESCEDLAIGAHDLVVLSDLTLAAAPAGSAGGGLS